MNTARTAPETDEKEISIQNGSRFGETQYLLDSPMHLLGTLTDELANVLPYCSVCRLNVKKESFGNRKDISIGGRRGCAEISDPSLNLHTDSTGC
jgi:hypothetical protein